MAKSPVARLADYIESRLGQAASRAPDVRKLHLGCGDKHLPGFFHVDLAPLPHIDHVGRVERLDFIDSDAVELVYACHVLEHFGRAEIPNVLTEWHRILEPGGALRLAVPDFATCAAIYYEEGLQDGLTGLIGLVSGGQRDSHDYHHMIFDEPLLADLLHQAGFREVRRSDWRDTEHSHIDDYSQAYLPHLDKENGRLMSLNLEAVK